MDYASTTHADLYHAANSPGYSRTLEEHASSWVEASATEQAWAVVKTWFRLLQSGEASLCWPDPFWRPKPGRKVLTQELADLLVAEIDEDFLIEKNRFPKESGLGPEFSRLPPHARLAFTQQLMDTAMTTAEIKEEAAALLATGWRPPGWHPPESAPPPATVSQDYGEGYG